MSHTKTHRRSKGASDRGFALPLVVLVALVSSLAVTVLLAQHSTGHLAMARHVRDYRSHHQGSGLREVVSRWVSTVHSTVGESIDGDGRAFDLEMPDSGTISVYMRDGQGTCLRDATTVTGRRREIVESMIELLTTYANEQAANDLAANDPAQTKRAPELFRPAGPAQISLTGASREVLLALCLSILPDARKGDDAMRLLERRSQDRTEKMPVKKAMEDLRAKGIEPEAIREFEAMLVDRPTLWLVQADSIGKDGKLFERNGGLFEASPGRQETYNQNAGFLTWDVLPLE